MCASPLRGKKKIDKDDFLCEFTMWPYIYKFLISLLF